MSERRRRESVADANKPSYAKFMQMDSFYDKLKLLHYDKEFYYEIRLKPISRHYFALQTNPGEQFFMFTALAAFLIRKSGKHFETPQESDDPNSTISNILDAAKEMDIIVDFPPNKLKQGFGDQVIFILDKLADAALIRANFTFKTLVHKLEQDDEDDDEVLPHENAEVVAEDIEEMIEEDFNNSEEEGDDQDDDDEPDLLDLEGMKNITLGKSDSETDTLIKPEGILESTVDSMDWKLEVERVLPQLKVTIRNDHKDWRSHIEQIHQHRSEIDGSLSNAKVQLDKLSSEISRTLEKIGSREKYLNNQLEQLLLDYREAQEQYSHVKDQYSSVSGGITERSRMLSRITEELEQIKHEMDSRGSNMTDGKPLVNIRKALSKIKGELSQMEVRIGVASHTLLQAKLKEKNKLQRSANIYATKSGYL